MIVSLLEARRPVEQRQLQADMARAWATMDQMDDASARRVLQRVAEMRADVLDRLAALPTAEIDGTETFASTSLRAFSAELEDAANRFATRYGMDLGTDMRAMAAFSDDAHRTALSNLARSMDVPPALISFSPLGLADAQIEAAVLFNNAAIKNVSQAVIQTVNRELQNVVFGGGSRWDAVRNIRSALATDGKDLGALTQRALTIERTGMVASFNIAAEHAYRQSVEELPDLLVEWMTATDKRVDPICVGLSGATKKPGGTFPGGYVAPPAHPRCRCRIVASLPGWKDLGKKPVSPVRPPATVGNSVVEFTPVRSKNTEPQIIGQINGRTDIRLVQAFGRNNPNWTKGLSADEQRAIIEDSVKPALAVVPREHLSDLRFIMFDRSVGGYSAASTGFISATNEATIRAQFAGKEGYVAGLRPDPQVLIHEIGHAITPKFSDDQALSWLRAVEYPGVDHLTAKQARDILVSDAVRANEPKVLGITGYGTSNARESWAEAYRAAYAGHLPVDPSTGMGVNRGSERPDSDLHQRLVKLAREIGDSFVK